MELLKDTHFDFMKYRRFWIAFSVIMMLPGFATILFPKFLNLGIDFAGGTQMTLRFVQPPHVDRLRSLLETEGLGDATIQTFGGANSNEVLIKARGDRQHPGNTREHFLEALDRGYNAGKDPATDLNRLGGEAIAGLLLRLDPDRVVPPGMAPAQVPESARAHYTTVANALVAERRKEANQGIFSSWDAVARTPGVSPAVVQALKERAHLGAFSVQGVEDVGPQIGKELRQKGFWAVVLSLAGMLAYIAFRFELRFGIGAVIASLHDVLVTLGLFVLVGFEFNLTTIAAFLTLVGYSVNDTVVIFDRMRENMRKNRRRPLLELMNESLNQTLSRTIMTSGLTFLTVLALLVLGGDVLHGFAFVMTVGIIVGTYSSIYIASPFALLWEHLFGTSAKQRKLEKAREERAAAGAGRGTATRTPAPTPPARPKASPGKATGSRTPVAKEPAAGDEAETELETRPRPAPRTAPKRRKAGGRR
jgi:preprotein translocase subunit SecF